MGSRAVRLVLVSMCAVALGSGVAPNAALSARRSGASALESKLLADINSLRQAHGLRPFKVASTLSAAAREHSVEMVTRGYFGHDSADRTSCDRRIARYYPMGRHHRWLVGENLLEASPDIDAAGALDYWMRSPAHRANILDKTFREIGLAAVHADAAPGAFVGMPVTVITADFGMRR